MDRDPSLNSNSIPLPNGKHRAFYEFLGISTSYQKVTQYKQKKIKRSGLAKIEKLDAVIKIYDLIGDVHAQPFNHWWDSGGYKIFSIQPKNSRLVKINFNKNLQDNIEQVKKIYQEKDYQAELFKPEIEFIKNKIPVKNLQNKLDLIYRITWPIENYDDDYKKLPQWFIAIKDKETVFGRKTSNAFDEIRKGLNYQKIEVFDFLSNIYLSGNKIKIKKDDDKKRTLITSTYKKNKQKDSVVKAKRYISMLASKHKNEAMLLAENAARGYFPSKERLLSTYLKFDFEYLRTINTTRFNSMMRGFRRYSGAKILKPNTVTRKVRKMNLEKQSAEDYLFHTRLLQDLDDSSSVVAPFLEQKAQEIIRSKYQAVIKEIELNEQRLKKMEKELSVLEIKKKLKGLS